ncbi:MAG: lipopolysaccharide biosynthesis protein [Planctomycetes bacterium]|nr:lipopolysaccharide biosynthesis protein [Planctomycetota bacterium]
MSRTRRSTLTYLTGLLFTGLTLVVGFVTTPVLLRWLGSERFGAFRAASDWGGYIGLLELGLGGALLPLLARSLSAREEGATGMILSAGVRAYTRAALAMLLAGGLFTFLLPCLVPVRPETVFDLRWGWCIGILGSVLVTPFFPFRFLAEAGQEAYIVNLLLVLRSLVIYVVAVILAYWNWGITGQYLAVSLGGVGMFLALAGYGRRRCPGLAVQILGRPPPAEVRRELWKLNWPTLAFNLCGRVSLLTDNILIACLLGPALVVPFVITQRLATLAQGQLQNLGTASWAGLAELHASRQLETFNKRLVELTSLVGVLGMASMIPIAAYNRPFVTLWIGADHFGGSWVSLLAVVNGYLLAIFSLWGWAINGTGQVAVLLPLTVVGTIVNFGLSLGGTFVFGLPGPLLGTGAALVGVYVWWMPLLLHRTFGISLRDLLGAVLRPPALGLPFAVVVAWASQAYPPCGWIGLGLEMAGTGFLYLALAWWVLLKREDRLVWRARVRFVLPFKAVTTVSPTRERGKPSRFPRSRVGLTVVLSGFFHGK